MTDRCIGLLHNNTEYPFLHSPLEAYSILPAQETFHFLCSAKLPQLLGTGVNSEPVESNPLFQFILCQW